MLVTLWQISTQQNILTKEEKRWKKRRGRGVGSGGGGREERKCRIGKVFVLEEMTKCFTYKDLEIETS